MLSDSVGEILNFDWTGLAIGHALRRALTLLFFVLLSAWYGDAEMGIFPIVGAVVVGFGSIRALGTSRATPMFFASMGIAVATYLGSLVGGDFFFSAIGTACAAFAFGLLSAVGPGTAWVAQNCLVFFLVLGLPFPSTPPIAFRHALLVLAGGLCQSVTLTVYYFVRRYRGIDLDPWFMSAPALRKATERALRSFFHGPQKGGEALVYGLRLAVALELGLAIGRILHFERSGWILMTTALVLKSDLRQTLSRGIGRCVGTMIGGLFATALVVALQPGHMALSVMLVASATAAYLVFYVNYALCTIFITSYVVFLLAFAGLPGPQVALLRVFATLIGGLLALLASFRWRRPVKMRR